MNKVKQDYLSPELISMSFNTTCMLAASSNESATIDDLGYTVVDNWN